MFSYKFKLLTLFLVVLLGDTICSTKFSFGECKNHNFFFDLNLNSFMGNWYPIYANTKKKIDCYKIKLKRVDQDQIQVDAKDTRMLTSGQSAQLFSTKSKNTYKISTGFLKGIITIMDTDYDSWAIVLTCSEYLMTKKHHVAIMTRKTKLSPELIQRLKSYIETKLQIKKLREIKQGESCDLA